MKKKRNDLYTIVDTPEGPQFRFFPHKGQRRMLESEKRYTLASAGTQGGKTSFAPLWLYKEILNKGPGDYLVVAPTYPLMQKKLLPVFRTFFEYGLGYGKYVGGSEKILTIHRDKYPEIFGNPYDYYDEPTRLMFGHAQDPESLESATAKGAVLDEAGQKKFKAGSWEAIMRRLSINEGRVLLPTTPYNLGWLYQRLYKPWKAGTDPDVEVIRFPSIYNPIFPRAEYDRAKRVLPKWKFDMFYRGIFTRPAGIIYDCFDDDGHVVPDFPIPAEWPRYMGVDFGGTNTAAIYVAEAPDGKYYIYKEYWPKLSRTAAEHKDAMLQGEAGIPTAVGGAKSEGQWRDEFTASGLPIKEPDISEVELGITRFYGLIKADRIRVLAGCKYFLEEMGSYSRELDDNDEPTEKIEDKNDYHLLDAGRYIFGWLSRNEPDYTVRVDWGRW